MGVGGKVGPFEISKKLVSTLQRISNFREKLGDPTFSEGGDTKVL